MEAMIKKKTVVPNKEEVKQKQESLTRAQRGGREEGLQSKRKSETIGEEDVHQQTLTAILKLVEGRSFKSKW